jgi:hypothetical protein
MDSDRFPSGSAQPCLEPSKDFDNLAKGVFAPLAGFAANREPSAPRRRAYFLPAPRLASRSAAAAVEKTAHGPDRLDRGQKTRPAHPRRWLIVKGGMPMPSDVALVVAAIVGLFVFFAVVLAYGDRTWRTSHEEDGLQG